MEEIQQQLVKLSEQVIELQHYLDDATSRASTESQLAAIRALIRVEMASMQSDLRDAIQSADELLEQFREDSENVEFEELWDAKQQELKEFNVARKNFIRAEIIRMALTSQL
jgi:hypothetical protein